MGEDKKNWKSILIVGALFISLGVVLLAGNRIYGLLARAGGTSAPENVQITQITANSATITFSTAAAVTALIDYGTNPTNLTLFTSDTQTTGHTIALSLLTPSTTYYFHVKIGDQTYDNAGVPWTFTTSGAGLPGVPSPTTTTTGLSISVSPNPSGLSVPTQTSSATSCRAEVAKRMGSTKGSINYDATYDMNKDGIINSADLAKCSS